MLGPHKHNCRLVCNLGELVQLAIIAVNDGGARVSVDVNSVEAPGGNEQLRKLDDLVEKGSRLTQDLDGRVGLQGLGNIDVEV